MSPLIGKTISHYRILDKLPPQGRLRRKGVISAQSKSTPADA